jgi:thiol:disulfide interchange protein
MELTFGDDDVYEAVTSKFVPLKFDVTAGTDDDNARKTKYGAETLPAVLFVDTDGTVLARIRKMTEVEEMLEIVKRAAARQVAAATPCTR